MPHALLGLEHEVLLSEIQAYFWHILELACMFGRRSAPDSLVVPKVMSFLHKLSVWPSSHTVSEYPLLLGSVHHLMSVDQLHSREAAKSRWNRGDLRSGYGQLDQLKTLDFQAGGHGA